MILEHSRRRPRRLQRVLQAKRLHLPQLLEKRIPLGLVERAPKDLLSLLHQHLDVILGLGLVNVRDSSMGLDNFGLALEAESTSLEEAFVDGTEGVELAEGDVELCEGAGERVADVGEISRHFVGGESGVKE